MTADQRPIIITEIPRSGASIIAAVLGNCGVWLGDSHGTSPSKRLSSLLARPMLRGLGCDPVALGTYPPTLACNAVAASTSALWRRAVCKIMERDAEGIGRPWAYLGADATPLWPVWRSAFPDARWIIVRRSQRSIIASCRRTGDVGVGKSDDDLFRWIGNFEMSFSEIMAVTNSREIWPSRALAGELGEVLLLLDWLGVAYDPTAVSDLLAPMAWGSGRFAEMTR